MSRVCGATTTVVTLPSGAGTASTSCTPGEPAASDSTGPRVATASAAIAATSPVSVSNRASSNVTAGRPVAGRTASRTG